MNTPARAPRTAPVAACPLCGSPHHTFRFEEPDRLFGVPGRYQYRACGSCGTVFQSPRVVLEDLHLLYPGTYYTHEPPSLQGSPRDPTLRGFRDELARSVRAAVQKGNGRPGLVGRLLAASVHMRERAFRDRGLDELIPRRLPAGRLLDVGCGTGTHMRFLAELGWEVEGLEWDSHAAEVARRVTQRPVTVGDVHGFQPSAPFDRVLLNHVFEHLPDPVADLRRLRELLSPHGRVVLVWPNSRGLGARRFGPAWFAWDPPRHLTLPPVSAVVAAAGSVGLKLGSWRSLGRGAASHAAYSRALREGRPVTLDHADINGQDRAFHQLERLLLLLDPEVGEEAVLVLER